MATCAFCTRSVDPRRLYDVSLIFRCMPCSWNILRLQLFEHQTEFGSISCTRNTLYLSCVKLKIVLPLDVFKTTAYERRAKTKITCAEHIGNRFRPTGVEREHRVWLTSSTQTCTKLEPQRHVLLHGNMPLQNAAVARAWGTSSEVHLSKFTFSR